MPPQQSIESALAEWFGYPDFRPGQRETIEAALAGRDVLAILPTCGGKSLTFQLPALLGTGVTIVISPLIALMKDQVDRLSARAPGVATFLNSTVGSSQARRRLERTVAGSIRLLYVAPERLRSTTFQDAAARMKVERIVVDEAHCVSEWGHDFRPDYLAIRSFADKVGGPPMLALTATATPTVRADIQRQLGLRQPTVVIASLDRPNLRFSVLTVPRKSDKTATLRQLVRHLEGSGILYTSTRRDAEDVARALADVGESVALYHAGLTTKERSVAQDVFLSGKRRVVVATNAFGLGVDKPDVRFVVHFAMPATPEAYFQEAGRAGRDGLPSRCILLFAPVDIGIQRFLVQRDVPDEEAMLRVLRALRRGGRTRALVDPEALAADLGMSEVTVRLAVAGLERADALVRAPDERGLMRLERLQREPDPRRWLPVTIDAERRRRRRLQLLWKMWDYAKYPSCRRVWWSRYFGDRTPVPTLDSCCDRCDPAGEPVINVTPPTSLTRGKATRTARVISTSDEGERVAIVLRVVEALNGAYGRRGVTRVLRGRRPTTSDATAAALPEFGALASVRAEEVEQLIDALVDAGHLEKDATVRPRLRLTATGRAYLAEARRLQRAPDGRTPRATRLGELAAVVRAPTADTMPALLAALDDADQRVRKLALVGIRRLALRADVPAVIRRAARTALGRDR